MTTPSLPTRSRRAPRRRRGGFTLIELLIVFGIIAALSTAMVLVIGDMLSTARTAATRATILKVHRMLEERRDGFSRYQLQQGQINTAMMIIRNANPQGLSERQIRQLAPVVARKILFKLAMPQNHFEKNLPNNIVSVADSSELLYWILTESTAFGVVAVGGGRFSASELGDTDEDGLVELLDGWGFPLRFYRWPTRLVRPNGPGQTIQSPHLDRARFLLGDGSADRFNQDPDDDPLGRFGDWVSAVGSEALYHTPATWHAPLVLSTGPDGTVGLFEPNNTADFGQLANPNGLDAFVYDNITNLNLPIGSN